MNKETYEALKRIVELYREKKLFVRGSLAEGYIERLEGWIDEVAKDYEE